MHLERPFVDHPLPSFAAEERYCGLYILRRRTREMITSGTIRKRGMSSLCSIVQTMFKAFNGNIGFQ